MKSRVTATLAILALLLMGGTAVAEQTQPQTAKAKPKAQKSKSVDTPLEQIHDYIEKQKAAGRIDTAKAGWKTSLPRFPEVDFSASKSLYWKLETSEGPIKVKFFQDVAPNHVANFLYLTELGFFDGIVFHRVINNFMAQGGDPTGSGSGTPGYRFAGEYDDSVKHDRPGLLSAANTGRPGTDGSQFFLTFVPTPWLDGKHTIYGEIVDGMDTLKKLESNGTRSGKPLKRMNIVKATISAK